MAQETIVNLQSGEQLPLVEYIRRTLEEPANPHGNDLQKLQDNFEFMTEVVARLCARHLDGLADLSPAAVEDLLFGTNCGQISWVDRGEPDDIPF